METFIGVMIFFMIIGALVALEARDLLSSIISIATVGFLLTISFLYLRAPDISIVQGVVDILTLVILIRATISRDVHFFEDEREFFPFAAIIVMIALFFVFLFETVKFLPAFGTNLSKVATYYLGQGLKAAGAPNIVSAVILDFRGYDTLGEAMVLFTAILGATVVLRLTPKKGKKKDEAKK